MNEILAEELGKEKARHEEELDPELGQVCTREDQREAGSPFSVAITSHPELRKKDFIKIWIWLTLFGRL